MLSIQSSGSQGACENTENSSTFRREFLAAVEAGREHFAIFESRWTIADVIYSPGGIQEAGLTRDGSPVRADEFGNQPHWVFTIRNSSNGALAYIGPDDVRTVFGDKGAHIAKLLQDKKKIEITEYLDKLQTYGRVEQSLGELGEIDVEAFRKLCSHRLGDRHFAKILELFRVADAQFQTHFNCGLLKFKTILDQLREIQKANIAHPIAVLSASETARLDAELKASDSAPGLSSNSVRFLLSLYNRFLELKNQSMLDRASWALDRAVPVRVGQEPKSPAYQANIWAARWITQNFPVAAPRILDVGANLSVFQRIYRAILPETRKEAADLVVDLECEPALYELAPNKLKVLASISDIDSDERLNLRDTSDKSLGPLFQIQGSFDILIFSFVWDHLSPRDVRSALHAIDFLLRDPVGDIPSLLVIACRELTPIRNSGLQGVLVDALGYRELHSETCAQNALTEDAKERIGHQFGSRLLGRLEVYVGKSFNLGIFAKDRPANIAKLNTISDDKLRLHSDYVANEWTGGTPISPFVSPEDLYLIDALSILTPLDFTVSKGDTVSEVSLQNDFTYRSFERRLACLLWMQTRLSQTDKTLIKDIVMKWDGHPPYLANSDVKFIMERPLERTRGRGMTLEKINSDPHLQKLVRAIESVAAADRHATEASALESGHRSGLRGKGLDHYIERTLQTFDRLRRQRIYSYWELYQFEEARRVKVDHPVSVLSEFRSLDRVYRTEILEAVDRIKNRNDVVSIIGVARECAIQRTQLEARVRRYGIPLSEYIDQPLPGWVTGTYLATRLSVDRATVQSRIEPYRTSNPEWIRRFAEVCRDSSEYYSPELQAIIAAPIESLQKVPDGWKNRSQIREELNLSESVLNRLIEPYRKSRPEHFQVFIGKQGIVSQFVSPELNRWLIGEVEAVRILSEIPPNWRTIGNTARDLGVKVETVQADCAYFRSAYPGWFRIFRHSTHFESVECISPDLISHLEVIYRPDRLCPPGWMTENQVALELGVSTQWVRKQARKLTVNKPELISQEMSENGFVVNLYAPELRGQIKETVTSITQIPEAPKGWKTKKRLMITDGLSAQVIDGLLKKLTPAQQARHVCKMRRPGSLHFSNYISPNLVHKLRRLNKTAGDGWATCRMMADTYGFLAKELRPVIEGLRESHRTDISMRPDGRSRITRQSEYFSPTLVAKVIGIATARRESIPRAPQGWASFHALAEDLGVASAIVFRVAKIFDPEMCQVKRFRARFKTRSALHASPELTDVIKRRIRFLESLPKAPAGWLSATEAAGTFNISVNGFKLLAHRHKANNHVQWGVFRGQGNQFEGIERFTSEFISRVRAQFESLPDAPKSWRNISAVAGQYKKTEDEIRDVVANLSKHIVAPVSIIARRGPKGVAEYISPEVIKAAFE